ncbi:AAA family ATPase [Butyrivibrio sp. JL13D10]|uniref:AAA family ATPase n=1 Tax=Butyrivibrio sp. JL13D10 TaxID=3236815 RepID=UPI0038B6A7AC
MNSEIAKSRINEVLRPDTMTTSRGDFLATHVTVSGIELYSKFDPNDPLKSVKYREAEGEEDVFEQFVSQPGDKHQFMLVMGESGAGKSHLIRWFNERLENIKPEDEVVLFIRRSDNTLKGTIKQLLEKPEVANLENSERHKRLVEATSVVDEKKLKSEILSKFVLEVANDENDDEDGEIQLRRTDRRRLAAFLKYKSIEDKLKRIDGPIDRIYLKVAQSNTIQTDVDASFAAADFELDDEEAEDVENNADKDTVRMAHELATHPEKTQIIANYLNNFLDTVIQRCSGLEPGDFEEIFKDIRRELKKQGKNLTILIEDITSFTGLNAALLNALTTEHTGYGNEDLCRVSSVIGITTGYYKDLFKTNYRARVSLFVNLPNDIFTEDYLYEFVGKYLNAMSLTNEQINDWVKDGALPDNYPVHNIVEGANWESYSLNNGSRLSLYPFTRAAIRNLYSYRLSTNQLRTPRYILQYIIEPIAKDILYRKESFPNVEELNQYNNNTSTVMRNKIFNMQNVSDSDKERLYLFVCMWGNGKDTSTKGDDGTIFISGISEKIFDELKLPIITSLTVEKDSGGATAQAETAPTTAKVETSSGKPSKPVTKVVSESKKKIDNALGALEKWINGGDINVGATTGNVVLLSDARDNINKFLTSGAINWQCEGVSDDNISKISKSKNKIIGFERQTKGLDNALFVLPANRSTQTVIEAFIRWSVEGKESWNFENGDYFALAVETWVESVKPELVKAIKRAADGMNTRYQEFSMAEEVLRQILFGQIDDWKKYNSDEFLKNDISSVPSKNEHSREWISLQDLFKRAEADKNNRETCLNYYNLKQGKGGSKIYLDRISFDETFNLIKKNKIAFKDVETKDIVAVRDKFRENYLDIYSRMDKACKAERQKVLEYVQALNTLAGKSEFNQTEIVELADNAISFYDSVNDARLYAKHGADELNAIKKNKKNISDSLTYMRQIIKEDDWIKQMILMSKDPLLHVVPFLELIKKLVNDLENVSKQIESKKSEVLEKTGKELKQPYQNEEDIIEECIISLERL